MNLKNKETESTNEVEPSIIETGIGVSGKVINDLEGGIHVITRNPEKPMKGLGVLSVVAGGVSFVYGSPEYGALLTIGGVGLYKGAKPLQAKMNDGLSQESESRQQR